MRGFKAISTQHSALSTQHSALKPAFTLVELIVSVAILLALMSMIGMIFSTAGKASGTAQASTALYRQLRQITDSIRQDLEALDPATGVMAIAGVEVNAYLTPDDRANGVAKLPHRADVLMLVNQRRFDPFVFDPNVPVGRNVAFDQFRQVVYGHANLARVNPSSGAWLAGTKRMLEGDPSPIPAAQWHLARRVVGFPVNTITGTLTNTGVWDTTLGLTSKAFTGEIDTIDDFADVYRGDWTAFNLYIWPGYFKYAAGNPEVYFTGTSPRFFGESSDCYLMNSGNWYKWNGTAWARTVVDPPPDLLGSPPAPGPWLMTTFGASTSFPQAYWPNWFYVNGSSRSFVDPNPPARWEQRMAAYFLPCCADFKVEFTYDDPREIALDPSLANREPVLSKWIDRDGDGTEEYYPKPQPIRWQTITSGDQLVWSKLSPSPSDYLAASPGNVDLRDMTNPFRWPKAVRITIQVYDPSHRLTEPVTQTIVHTF